MQVFFFFSLDASVLNEMDSILIIHHLLHSNILHARQMYVSNVFFEQVKFYWLEFLFTKKKYSRVKFVYVNKYDAVKVSVHVSNCWLYHCGMVLLSQIQTNLTK